MKLVFSPKRRGEIHFEWVLGWQGGLREKDRLDKNASSE
jgi:hypothetical protein